MAALAIAIPAPIPEDPENVVTALETAAHFGARGDASEALRWVRHAATSAGESGRDARALDLARAAADLTPVPSETPAPPASLPAPSSRPSASPRASEDRPGTGRPAPPSTTRPQPRASQPPASVSPRASQAPRPWPSSERRSSVAPRPVVVAKEPEGQRPSESPVTASPAEPRVGGRNAARVAVSPSAEPGVFVLRVLSDDARPPSDGLEAYLVLADPAAELRS